MQGSELHKAIRKPQILVFGAFISDICIYVKSNSCVVSFFNIHCMQLYVRKMRDQKLSSYSVHDWAVTDTGKYSAE